MTPEAQNPKPHLASLKSFIIPFILWAYIFSVVSAQKFWGAFYQKIIVLLDLSPSQSWSFCVLFNFLVVFIGIPQLFRFYQSTRRREQMHRSRLVAVIFCAAAVFLMFYSSIRSFINNQSQLVKAAQEIRGGKQADIFEDGHIISGFYSNSLIGVSVGFPESWHVMSLNEIRRANDSGAHAIAGTNAQLAAALASEQLKSYPLLVVRKYADNVTGFKPSLALSTYDKYAIAATGPRTLEEFANSFTSPSAPRHVIFGPARLNLGDQSAFYIDVESQLTSNTLIRQHIYLTETDTRYVLLTASVMDPADFGLMQTAMQSLRINKLMAGH